MSTPLARGMLGRWGTQKAGAARSPAGDPRRGGSDLLCAKSLHRTGKYDIFVILEKNLTLNS